MPMIFLKETTIKIENVRDKCIHSDFFFYLNLNNKFVLSTMNANNFVLIIKYWFLIKK